MHVVGHASQDHGRRRFRRIAANGAVPVNFLDPFEVDDRHHADQEIDEPRDVVLIDLQAAVQTLVEQEIRVSR